MPDILQPVEHNPFTYNHPWQIFKDDIWTGAIRWANSETGLGWLHKEAVQFCPCNCKVFNFEILKTSFFVYENPDLRRNRMRLPFSLGDEEYEDAAVTEAGWACDLVVINFKHDKHYGNMWIHFDKSIENSGNITKISFVEALDHNYLHAGMLQVKSILLQKDRVAVLTCVGNPGMGSSENLFIKGRGHSAMIVGGEILSWSSGGWEKCLTVKNYFSQPENKRPIIIQELSIFSMPNLADTIRKSKADGVSWWPYLLPINWLPLIALLITGDHPFLIPGGVCSQQVAEALNADPGWLPFFATTPRDVFFEVRDKYKKNIVREYYIFNNERSPTQEQKNHIERTIDQFLGKKYTQKTTGLLRHAQEPDVRSWVSP